MFNILKFYSTKSDSKYTVLIHKVRLVYNIFNFLIQLNKTNFLLRNFPQYFRSFSSVTLFRYFNVCKVLSMLEDDATFNQATIFRLNLPQRVKRLHLDFSKRNGKGTMRCVSLCMWHKEWTRRREEER